MAGSKSNTDYVTSSILNSVKKDLGIDSNYDAFDVDVIHAINTAFSILTQLGAGPSDGFMIHDHKDTWESYLGESKNQELIKTYISAKVKSIFDPPANGTVMDSLQKTIAELEWRIMMIFEHGDNKKG